ncbi:MAG: response regulator [Desulfobacterales bacterium]|nr:response regulator [Desulfobacterales bacterium]
MKILMVDDNDDIRKMLKRKFRKTDWEILEAVNGREGVDMALEHLPDLVLMDMHMPVLDGHEAVRLLREKGFPGTIVALTASVMRSDTDRAIEDGCDHFIAKPVKRDFINQIREILEAEAG